MIVAAAMNSGISALTTLPKKSSSTNRATGSTIISARARSSSTIGPVSCPTAASPPTSVGSKPAGVPSASRISGSMSAASVSSIGSDSVANVMWPSWPTRSRLPVEK